MEAASSVEAGSVAETLLAALHMDPAVRVPAERALASWEAAVGFVAALVAILGAAAGAVEPQVRWLAAVHVKNAVNRHWRARGAAQPGVQAAEKAHVRAAALELLGSAPVTADGALGTHVALLLARIARFDYPKEWPELLPGLVGRLQHARAVGDGGQASLAFVALHHVLKALASKRFAADKEAFQQLTQQLFDGIWQGWVADTQEVARHLGAAAGGDGAALQQLGAPCGRWIFGLKLLRRMLVHGFPGDEVTLQEVPAVTTVSAALLQALAVLVPAWHQVQRGPAVQGDLQKWLERSCLKCLKTLTDVQAAHPWTFRASLADAVEYAFGQVCGTAQSASRAPPFDRLLIQCMLFLQGVLKCTAYRPPSGATPPPDADQRDLLKRQLKSDVQPLLASALSMERIQHLMSALIHRYLPLREEDLRTWADEPEAFHHEQTVDGWKEQLRPCAENIFLLLLERHRDELAPVVLEMVKRACEACPPGTAALTPQVLAKDATYNALGTGAYELHDHVDFTSVFGQCVLPELAVEGADGKVMRRRAVWLIGQWVTKIDDAVRLECYGRLAHVLTTEDDAAVRLAAVSSLRALVDDWNFTEEPFLPFVAAYFDGLFFLVQSAVEFDTQLQAFSLIALIVERLRENVVPHSKRLLARIPDVWREADGLLRLQVIQCLHKLVVATSAESEACHALVLPVLKEALDPSHPDFIALVDDALLLYLATVRHAPRDERALWEELFPLAEQILSRSFENIKIVMRLIESFVLLSGVEFLKLHGGRVASMLDSVIGNVREQGMLLMLPVVDLIMLQFPRDGPPMLEGVLQKLLALVLAPGDESDAVVSTSLAVLGRILLQTGDWFHAFLARCLTLPGWAGKGDVSQLIVALVDVWLDKADSMSTVAKRKLSGLALASLLSSSDVRVLERLDVIYIFVTSVVFETETDPGAAEMPAGQEYWVTHGASLGGFTTLGAGDSDDDEAGGDANRRQLASEADLVNILSMSDTVRTMHDACRARHGQAFDAALQRLDRGVVGQLERALAAAARAPLQQAT